MKKLSLRQWGMICIFGGVVSHLVGRFVMPPKGRAEMAGQAAASLLFILIGVGLCVMPLMRWRIRAKPKEEDEPKKKS